MNQSEMALADKLEVVSRLMLAFPNLSADLERVSDIHRRIAPYPFAAVMQATEEYINHANAKYLELSQYMAVVFRVVRQESERDASVAKARSKFAEEQERLAMKADLARADAVIAEMTDADVLVEWAPLLAMMAGKPHEWASSWSAATVRTVQRFRLKIAALTKVRSA